MSSKSSNKPRPRPPRKMRDLTVDEYSKKEFLSLRGKITFACSVIIALIFAIVFIVLGVSEYNSKMEFLDDQLTQSMERSLKYRTADELAANAQNTDAKLEIGIGSEFNPETYIPIILYKCDYETSELIPLDITSAQLSAQSLEKGATSMLGVNEGFYKMDDTSLVVKKQTTDEGDIVAITDCSSIDAYIDNLVKMFASVFVFIVILSAGIFWSLSNWMISPVKDMWKRQQRFIADASHELKTPVSVIMANADIIERTSNDTEVSQRVKCIADESDKMKQLIGDMMYLLTDKALTAKKEEMDLSRMCQKLAMTFEAKAWEKQLVIDSEGVERGIKISADPTGIERVVSILLDNACKYADENTQIDITLESGRRHAHLSVKNKGPVIPEESLEAVFDRFFRTDDARTRTTETSYGLGLSMAKDIVVANGGRVYAQSGDDGTIFVVELPLMKDAS